MDKVIVVGDLHGQVEVAQLALDQKDYGVIFIGDYVDAYDRTRADQISTLEVVVNAATTEPDRVIALRGNHEFSYQDPEMRCSGYSKSFHRNMMQKVNLSILLDYVWFNDYLISHAGVSNKLLTNKGISLDEYLTLGDFKQIGYSRGGRQSVGGLFWCDWWDEFEPVEGVPQVVGHSSYRPTGEHEGIVTKGNSYQIDCLDRVNEVLVLSKDSSPEVMIL